MNTFRYISTLAGISFLALSSCTEILNVEIVGNGNNTTSSRNISGYSGLYMDTDFEVIISSADQYEMNIETDSNLLPYIITEINDDQLEISVKPNFRISPRQFVRIYLKVPDSFSDIEVINGGIIRADSLYVNDLNASILGVSSFYANDISCSRFDLFAEGSTSATINDGEFEDINVRQKGSGNIVLDGKSTIGNILLEGSGKIDSKQMVMEDADIRIYGSGLIMCNITGTLNTKIDGNGRIYYYSNPIEIKEEITGDGMVVRGY